MHALPGAQNQHWHSDNPTQWASFWSQRQFQDRVVNLWEAIAEHYRGNPWVAGYNPVNEPADAHGSAIGPFYRRLESAIRAVDPDHILFLDGNRYSTQFDQLGDPLPDCVYTAHDYALPGFVDGDPYPGVSRGQYIDRDRVEQTFLERTAYMRETGTPIWVGEFGPVYTGNPAKDEERYRLLQDQLEIFAHYDASWALWTYKDIGLQGVVTVDPESAYLRLLAPFLEKKARLGVDSWGSTDAGVRDILDPIERLFADEFPDFQPYPWGAPLDPRACAPRHARRGHGRRLRARVHRRRGRRGRTARRRVLFPELPGPGGARDDLAAAGVAVPRDLSVVGFDDLPIAQLASPRLTTIRQPLREMAEHATRLVLESLENPQPTVTRVELATSLIVRDSAAAHTPSD